ncbi:MAG TPA: protein-L-isoaspartate(D-aspartate) O-methyltransferase [Sedimentisphaerales bacterium]|nr:protein-L-isoaspartate(D-aspartate) O-methyltransferase [Sedimentisphaerales bacterium]
MTSDYTYKITGVGLLSVFMLVCGFLPLDCSRRSAGVFGSEQGRADANESPPDVNCPVQQQEKKDSEKKKIPRPTHTHAAFQEYVRERADMVNEQIKARGIKQLPVLDALYAVPRHAFVRQRDLRRAYSDQPVPIGMGQTISQPYIVGYMTEALKLNIKSKVLEIGTGSGYQAAVCAEIAGEVYTVEIIEELAAAAGQRLAELGYGNVFVKAGDGYLGWAQNGPYDAIIVTCAAGFIPPALIEQVKVGGKIIAPLGSAFGVQTLVLISKDREGRLQSKRLLPVRFVPMVGQIRKERSGGDNSSKEQK